MADISQINVGGIDFNTKDATARTNSATALSQLAYQETGNTASQAYSVIGTPINWKGTLYHTKTAVAKGATWVVGTNLTLAPNLGKLTSNIKTYVNGSGELVFRDLTGADTVLPFSGTSVIEQLSSTTYSGTSMSVVVPKNVEIVQLITGYGGQTPFDHQILVTDMGEFIFANYAHLSSWNASTRTLTSSSAWGDIWFTVIYYGYQS